VSPNTLDPEDLKIITLARSARARVGAAEGAAVRDDTGRTYVACTVALPSLSLSALQVAVAMAVASGASGLEAAAVVSGEDEVADGDLAAVRDLGGPQTPVHLVTAEGTHLITVPAGTADAGTTGTADAAAGDRAGRDARCSAPHWTP
jgi:hypothetical protein